MDRDKARLATVYSDYALTLTKMKKYSQADSIYRRALKIARSSAGVKDSTLEVIKANYARLRELRNE